MAIRKGGQRRKTRHKLMKSARTRGKISMTRYLQNFNAGDKVILIADSSVHEGMYHPRFHGKEGQVLSQKGRCYYIQIRDGGKDKQIIVHPVHLTRIQHGQTTTA